MQLLSTRHASYHFDSSSRILTMVWNEESKELDEEGVKTEISRIIDFVRAFAVRNVIVDARNYSFRENLGIQNWINKAYIPLIMELEVAKYAIIVGADVYTEVAGTDNEEDSGTLVEYFTRVEDASKWIG